MPAKRMLPRLTLLLTLACGVVSFSGCGTLKRIAAFQSQEEPYVSETLPDQAGVDSEPLSDSGPAVPTPMTGKTVAKGRDPKAVTGVPRAPERSEKAKAVEEPPAGISGGVAVPATDLNVAGDAENYRIHPGDTLHIQVRGEDDLSGDFRVSSEGVITFPLVGRIAVAGTSATTVETNLTASLAKDYLVNPRVYIQVRSSIMRRVIVFGEVKSPGVYELPVGDRFTLLQVIAKAGGLTDLAATDRVRIVRRNGAEESVIKVSVTDLLKGRGESRDIELQPNDVITVPQTIF